MRRRRRKSRRGCFIPMALILMGLCIGVPILLVRSCTISFFSPRKVPLVSLWDEQSQILRSMTLEEYVEGVVAAEMPASFQMEALKAQAVAARTYAYRRITRGDTLPNHPEAHLSSDYASGQAWISWNDFLSRFGLVEGRRLQRRIQNAVRQTAGVIATYQSEPILAVYHSTSGGRTENSEHYWSEALPYLRSVADPFSSDSPHHYSTAAFTLPELAAKLEVADASDIRLVERYPSGRVKTVEAGGQWFSGRTVRQRLGLKSTWFSVEPIGDEVVFSVWGYGHGVGMSQYGAQGMAEQGYGYKEILKYYYRDIDLVTVY